MAADDPTRCSTYRLPAAELAVLADVLDALANTTSPADELFRAAFAGACTWGRSFADRLREVCLSRSLEELRASDEEEWWRVEALLKERDLHVAVARVLLDDACLGECRAATHSAAYARHREAVEAVTGRRLPSFALLVVPDPSSAGDSLEGWLPPYEGRPWAVVLTRRLGDGRLDGALLHELVHATQAEQLSPLDDDKEVEWVLGVGNRTVLEGATETLARRVRGQPRSDLYAVERLTFAWLARRLGTTTAALARRVSAVGYPLGYVAELLDVDDADLARQILARNGAAIARRQERSRG